MGRGVAGRGQGVAAGSGGAGSAALRPWVAWPDRGAFPAGGVGIVSGGVDGWSPDDRDGDVHSLDGAQDALPVGVSDACGGGLGLDSFAAVLPDFVERAGAGRVDGPQADQATGLRDGVGVDAHVDRERDAGEALSCSCGEGRLDRDRGGREVSDRCGVWPRMGPGAGAGGSQAGAADRREQAAGAGSLASDGPPAAGDHAHDPSALRGGEGRGAQADQHRPASCCERSVREARRLAKLARSQGAWPGREGQAESGGQARAARGSLREGRLADHAAGRRANQSASGSCRCQTRMPGRSSRASWASRTEFGYVTQLAEVTENTKRGARGLILPASTAPGNPAENTLLPDTVAELKRLGSPRARSRSTAGSSPARRTRRSKISHPSECSSPAAKNRLQTHQPPATALPHRGRGPDQPPQAPLRDGPQPPEGRRRPADLDRVGNPRL